MITVRYNYNEDGLGAMKCAGVYLSKGEFLAWYEKNKDNIKNVTTIPRFDLPN